MSLSITINNINTLSDAERAVLRLIAGNEVSVADTLKAAVRGMADEVFYVPSAEAAKHIYASEGFPIEPEEVYSPHTQVSDAPVATVPTPPAAPANPNLDANGLPWDKRIHSSSRAKVADGTWRYARNLDKALIATVEAELRAVQAIPSPAVIGVDVASGPDATGVVERTDGAMTSATVTPAGWPFGTGTPEAQDAAALVQDAAPAPIIPLPSTVPPAPTSQPMTFAQLMQHVTPLLVSGKLTQPILQGVVEKCGLPHLAALGARPDLVETVKAAIDEAVGGVQ